MMSSYIFISHATKDDAFVKELREELDNQGISVWVDSRNLRGGDKLKSEIGKAIENARGFIAVISMNTMNSPWVRKEINKALKVEKAREDYRVIPLMLPGVEPSALKLWFGNEPVGEKIRSIGPGGLMEAMPGILAALGERPPVDYQPMLPVEVRPVEELVLELADPIIEEQDGKRTASATATLRYHPAKEGARNVESKRFTFIAPIGTTETDELRWYLERYHIWPVGVFRDRAERIEGQLPKWGNDLYKSAFGSLSAQDALNAWRNAAVDADRRISVLVDSDLPEGTDEKKQAAASEAASDLLSLPWELLYDGVGYLFQGRDGVRIRRRLPNRHEHEDMDLKLPIRILLVSPRPEDKHAGYFDHRSSALPLVQALEGLGKKFVSLTVLTPPTFPAMEKALRDASQRHEPFHVVHFDGHGVYDREHGLGALCFEDPKDDSKHTERASILIHARDVAAVMRDYRILLVFLDACQTAMAEDDPTASVAARLLEGGVASIVAMSHSVLVETARRFVAAFYQELATGKRVGSAMLAGQMALMGDSYRGRIMGADELRLQDWFVPVLYQEEHDQQLVGELPPEAVRQLQDMALKHRFGDLPSPSHGFIGRSRELLALERMLHQSRYAVIWGQGGAGKTALAAELGRWLVRTGRFGRGAFVRMDTFRDVRGALDSIGHQLLTEGDRWSVTQYPDLKQALLPVKRALSDHPTFIVIDNMESILPGPSEETPPEAPSTEELFCLCQELLDADRQARIVFTSREHIPQPFDGHEIELGALDRDDAIKLVEQVMAEKGLSPAAVDPGRSQDEIAELVESVNRHARALVLLAPEVSTRGVRTTIDKLYELMAELHERHPDDRERSLYASVELSLCRLPEDVRKHVDALAVFHRGASMGVLGAMLDISQDESRNIGKALVDASLGRSMGYGYIQLDPALPPYLLSRMGIDEQERLRAGWGYGMIELTDILYEQYFQDARLAADLTLLELPNLLAILGWAQDSLTPEETVELASVIETLISNLGRPQALAYAVSVHDDALKELGTWSHARYLVEKAGIDRLLERGNLRRAYEVADRLLKQGLQEGEGAYPEAGYDITMVYFCLGRVLRLMGLAEVALEPLAEAYRRFQLLADVHGDIAKRMAAASISEGADCLCILSRLDDATEAYGEAIRLYEELGNIHGVAVCRGNMVNVRIAQRRYQEALDICAQARDTFGRLGEPLSVAISWHQAGIAHRFAGQYDMAEDACQQALAIYVRVGGDRSGEARTLNELGSIYHDMEKLEDAVKLYRQAANIYVELGDMMNEGKIRRNIANTLIKLHRYDESRQEVMRTIECNKPYGHAAEPWEAWAILHDLEKMIGDSKAVDAAKEEAIRSYMAYRQSGGEGSGLYMLVVQAIQKGNVTQLERELDQLSEETDDPQSKVIISKLRAILGGDCDPSLADDPALDYRNAVELKLILECLNNDTGK